MVRISKTRVALCLALAMLLSLFAACGGGGGETTTEPSAVELTVNASASAEPSTGETTLEEPGSSGTEVSTETDHSTSETTTTTQAGSTATTTTTTTAATTTAADKKPTTTAEIVEYFNKSANKVKTDKPGYSWRDRAIIDKDSVSISSRTLQAMAPTLISWAEGLFAKWTEKDTVAKGANHNDFPVSGQSWSSTLTPAMVSSAICTDAGTVYKIKITLKDEKLSELPVNPTTTNHGKAMNLMTKKVLEEGTANIPLLKITQFAPTYTGSYIDCTIDKATGNIKSINYMERFKADITVNVGNTTASVMIGLEKQYDLKY
ncbi:MAG: hypothetical protein FWH26_04160 [Oscillospiraceae bacterium]|nr:hypothetical protein [Oscillospiraceae bacterium]